MWLSPLITRKPFGLTENSSGTGSFWNNLFKLGADLLAWRGGAEGLSPLFREVTLGHTWVGTFSPNTRGAEKWKGPAH